MALAALSLLIAQLRLDLSGKVISPEAWFKMHITDYDEEARPAIMANINTIVEELGLDSRFLCD